MGSQTILAIQKTTLDMRRLLIEATPAEWWLVVRVRVQFAM